MSYKQVLSVLTLSVLCSSLARAEDEEKPALKLRSLKYLGSGCQPSSETPVEVSIEDDVLKMRLPAMYAELGPEIPVVNNRRNCVVTLDFAVPKGWSYALQSFRLDGFLALDAGARADLSLSSFFEGSGLSQQLKGVFDGPKETALVMTDMFPWPNLQWSPCDAERRLNVNVGLRVSNSDKKRYPEARGLLTIDSWEFNPLSIIWRKC